MILLAILTLVTTANAQWTLQTNPLGSGDAAAIGKIQFVSATEGWVSSCKTGTLLHTINGGNTWSIVTPYSSEVSGCMSDPAIAMSWTNASHGWAMKTSGGSGATAFDEINCNGGLLYSTSNGGSSWNRYAFPTTVATTVYTLADLIGTWQLQQLTTNDSNTSSESSWNYGTIGIDATGAGTYSFTKNTGKTETGSVPLTISSCGIISVMGETNFSGFMSDDKQSIVITMNGGNGRSLMIMHKVDIATTYATADLAGTWQMHGLTTPNASSTNTNTNWTYGSFTINASGTGVGTSVSSGGNSSSENVTFVINSAGIVTVNGIDIYGFMSADKQSITFVMTENGGYSLITLQKINTNISYTSADLTGKWQMHGLTTSSGSIISTTLGGSFSSSLGAWTKGVYSASIMDNSISNIVVNGTEQDKQSITLNISSSGVISANEYANGFMSADKQTIYLTKNTTENGITGYQLIILQRDKTTSGDMGLQVQFADNNNGWASVFNIHKGSGQLFHSTDGGANWTQVPQSMLGFFYFVNASNGWLVSSAGSVENINTIYHTTDGGVTWSQQFIQATRNGEDVSFNAIYFSDLTHGWAVGKSGNVLKTTDGGTTWTWVTTTGMSTSSTSKCVFFLDANTGWISSNQEHSDGIGTEFVLATKDGGITWTAQPTPVNNSIYSLSFVDANHGWLTSDNGQIARFSQSSFNITAGGLSAALTTEEKNTVTGLAINGKMDARDFKSLRDEMPQLSFIDLSAVSVDAYSGSEGTYNNTTSITYPANTIPQRAFYNIINKTGKTSLTSFIFPASVSAIGYAAFQNCTSLNTIALPKTVTYIGNSAFAFNNLNSFSVASDNPKYSVIDGVLYNKAGTHLVAFPNAKTMNFDIPSGVVVVDTAAFEGAANLNSVTIPASVTGIGGFAFYNCPNLYNIHASASTPIDLAASDSVFWLVDKNNSVLYVPAGSKDLYQIAAQWKDFANIIEENQIITYSVTVPVGTNECYIVGDMNNWNFFPMNKVDDTHYTITLSSLTSYGYKYCSGPSWSYQELDESNNSISNRTYTTSDIVAKWKHVYDPANPPSNMTYSVTVPSGTNACYIIGDMNNWNFTPMTKVDATHYTITLTSSSDYDYKYCNGTDWAYIEVNADGSDLANNRTYTTNDIVAKWKDVTDISTIDADRFTLYPNPATDGFYINAGEKSILVSIYDINGTLMLTKQILDKEFVNISAFKQGVYVIKIQTKKGKIVKKLVKN